VNIRFDPDGVLTALEIKRIKLDDEAVLVGSKGWFPAFSADRPGKALNIRWYKPDVVAFGSSNVATYFDTRHPALQRWSERPAYNFGLAGLTAFELEQALHHAVALKRPRLVIIALEFYMFGAQRWDGAPWTLDHFPMAYSPTYRSELVKLILPRILSWSGPIAKLKRIVQSASAEELDPSTAVLGKLHDIDRTQISALYPAGARFTFEDPKGRSSIDALKRVIAFAQQNGIELRIMVSPHHAREYEIIRALSLWPMYEEWLRKLGGAVEAANKGKGCWERIEILNFGEYRPLNIDLKLRSIAERSIFERFDDSFHYNEDTSHLLIDEMLTRDPCRPSINGVAIALSRDTVDEYIAEMREARGRFASGHPDQVADVKALVAGLARPGL
jgi:hypothetical protein